VAVPWNSTGSSSMGPESVGGSSPIAGDTHSDWAQAFEGAKRNRAQALNQLASPLFAAHRKRILDLSLKTRLPAACQERTFVVDGCLRAYGPSFPDRSDGPRTTLTESREVPMRQGRIRDTRDAARPASGEGVARSAYPDGVGNGSEAGQGGRLTSTIAVTTSPRGS
jgi:hypothetical protein